MKKVHKTRVSPDGGSGLRVEDVFEKVQRYARRICRDGHHGFDSGDVTDEVMVKLLQYNPKFDGTGTPDALLRRITINAFLDLCRQTKRYTSVDPADIDASRAATSSDLDDLRMWEELSQQVSKEARRLLELHIVEGWSYEELAAVCDSTVGKVKGVVARALKELFRYATRRKR